VRVTDNALSRDLFPTDYYCLGDNENRPIKWLAIESLLHKQFTGASDVVSITRPWRQNSMYFYYQDLPAEDSGVCIAAEQCPIVDMTLDIQNWVRSRSARGQVRVFNVSVQRNSHAHFTGPRTSFERIFDPQVIRFLPHLSWIRFRTCLKQNEPRPSG